MKNVLIHIYQPDLPLWNFPKGLAERWQSKLGPVGVRVVEAREKDHFLAELASAEVVIGGGLNPRTFPHARVLKWVQTTSAGVSHLLFPELVKSPVVVTNGRGLYAVPMAEHLLAMMLALVRKISRARDYQREKRWGQDEIWRETPTIDELPGKTFGIVGFGSIGRELAIRSNAMGMRVLALRRQPDDVVFEGVGEIRGPESLAWLVSQCDFVADCLPETERTRSLFDKTVFSQMKPGAYFLNVGRGKTVDEPALIQALESGHLAGAGLDVTAEEPLPEDSPLYRIPSVVLTPHISGGSARFWDRASDLFTENLSRYFERKPLLNLVDKQEGY